MIVIVALAMVVLLVFVAFAVDLGRAWTEERADQSAADTAVMGGGVQMLINGGDLQQMVTEARRLVDANLGRTVGNPAWTDCTDTDQLFWSSTNSSLGLTNGSPCISFSQGFNQLRVRVPDQDVATAFARVVGVSTLTVAAAAEATVGANGGGAFPSSVFATASGGQAVCLVTGPNNAENCADPTSGQFGSIQPYFYTEIATGNPSTLCTSGNQKAPLARAFADGLDHSLGFFPGGYDPGATYASSQLRVNGSGCPSNAVPACPNIVRGGVGFDSDALMWGLITGNDYDGVYQGRLVGGPFASSSASIFGYAIDNEPIWTFLRDDLAISTPLECRLAAAWDSVYSDARLVTLKLCLASWVASMGVLFKDSVSLSDRLTTVPRFHESEPGPASTQYHIDRLQPVFVESIFAPISGSMSCSTPMILDPSTCEHHAGQASTWTASGGSMRVTSMSALVVPCGSLPTDICQRLDPSTATDPSGYFYSIELSK